VSRREVLRFRDMTLRWIVSEELDRLDEAAKRLIDEAEPA
jgi:hypothetical protein